MQSPGRLLFVALKEAMAWYWVLWAQLQDKSDMRSSPFSEIEISETWLSCAQPPLGPTA